MSRLTTLEKGINILFLFNEDHPVLDVPTIVNHLKLPKSTVYRYIQTLVSKGLLEKNTRLGSYQLGMKVLELARIVRQRLNIIDYAYPIMEELASKSGETVLLMGLYGRKAICMERIESRHSLRLSFERGTVHYLHAGASAKVLLAHLGEEQREQVIKEEGLPRLTDETITEREELGQELSKIREEGYAISTGEVDSGAFAIAAPIFDEHGRGTASLSIGGPLYRLDNRRKEQYIKWVTEAAKQITGGIRKQIILNKEVIYGEI